MDDIAKYCIPSHLIGLISQCDPYVVKLLKVDVIKKSSEYYLMAIYKHNTANTYFLLIDYGKFGNMFSSEFYPFFNLQLAIKKFTDIYFTKTGYVWSTSHDYHKIKSGKYKVFKSGDYVINHENVIVAKFLNTIFNNCTQNIFYCGSLERASEILKYIYENIDTLKSDELTKLSKEYYEIIPTKKEEIINCNNITKIIQQNESIRFNKNIANIVVDETDNIIPYLIDVLDDKCIEFEYIKSYMGSIPRCVLKLTKEKEEDIKTDIKTEMLLWHGTNDGNLYSILLNGLMLSHKPSLMFGNGIYLADHFQKSKGYCQNFLLLCTINTDNIIPKNKSNHILHQSIDSKVIVKGVGMTEPISFNKIDNILIPDGTYEIKDRDYCLKYNEYVVYDPSLVTIKYVVMI